MLHKPLSKPLAVTAAILAVVIVICMGCIFCIVSQKKEISEQKTEIQKLEDQAESLQSNLSKSNQLLVDRAKALKQSIVVFKTYSDSISRLQLKNKTLFQSQVSDLTNKSNDELRKIANN